MPLFRRLADSPFAVILRDARYGRFAAGNFVSLTGTWMQRIAAGWLAWELTGQAGWLGALALVFLGPSLVVALPAGVLADRFDRLAIMRSCQLAALGVSGLLAGLAAADLVGVATLIGFTLAGGVLEAVTQPARLALVPDLAPEGRLGSAIALNSVIFNLAHVLGPALAGLAILASGPWLAFAGNAASFAAFYGLLRPITAPPPDPHAPRAGVARQIGQAWRYIARHPFLAPLFALLTTQALLLRPLVDLLPAFVDSVLAGGPALLAALSASIGLGALLSGLWLGQRGSAVPAALVRRLRWAAGALAVAVLAFVALPSRAAALPVLLGFGLALAGTGITAQTLAQGSVDNDRRGRVMSLYGLLFRSAPALGGAVIGPAGDWLGIRWAVGAAALAGLAVLAALWRPIERGRSAAARPDP